jgi:polysaccharide chain length determinant protein (PEP-CTERM system associated)
MIPKDGLDVKYFLAAFKRRLWYVVIPFFLVFMAVVIYCIKAPRIYRSSCLILVQPQEVPRDYIRPTVTTDVQSRLSSITEQIMSRSRLENIIIQHNLYPASRAAGDVYGAVLKMRSKIKITFKQNSGRRGSPPAFEVAFEGREPVKVRDVTDALANIFIDENLKIREEQAAGTSRFLERELERMREILRQREKLVVEFRQEYTGFLPEQMQNNYRILSQLQQHLDSINTALQKSEDRKVLLKTQLSRLGALRAGDTDQELYNLDELRQKLERLKLRYSYRHPDVVRLKALIARLDKEEQITPSDIDSEAPNLTTDLTEDHNIMHVRKGGLLDELQMHEKEIQLLHKEKAKTSSQIEKYRERIELGPKIEQMFVDLRRDYQTAGGNYQSLLQKKLEADLAQNLERTQKGEQFRIQDHAYLPREPHKPDIPKMLTMVMMLALGSGFGLAFLLEYLDPTFWSRKDLEAVLELPVLVSVPVIQTDKERRWNKLKLAATMCFLLVMSSTLLYAMYVLWKKVPGLLPIPL